MAKRKSVPVARYAADGEHDDDLTMSSADDDLTVFSADDEDEFLAFLVGDWVVDGDIFGFFGF